MSKSTWTGAVSSDWADAGNWSPAGIPGVSSDVVIASGTPVALASASIGTVNSITDSSDLRFRSAGTNRVTTFLDNSGETRAAFVQPIAIFRGWACCAFGKVSVNTPSSRLALIFSRSTLFESVNDRA
jgi:hypothetical protein